MTKRRGRGEGGLHWDEKRQRWIASVTTGYHPGTGKRIIRRGSGKTKTEAREKLKQVLRDHEDGLATAPTNYTVSDAVNDWLIDDLSTQSASTIDKHRSLATTHVIPSLGARKYRDLSAEDVDKWLAHKAKTLSTRTLGDLLAIGNRATNRAMARDKVRRNVFALCKVPKGQPGRPSKSLTLEQTRALLAAAEGDPMEAYVATSVLVGARTEELRALGWDHTDLDGRPDDDPPVPPNVMVWHSVREGGDTKTKKSRRSLALPLRCIAALRRRREQQDRDRMRAGSRWQEHGLVFTTKVGTPLDAANVRRGFRRVVKKAGLDAKDWTPRELRHSFVSLLSDNGVSIEDIADLCGHSGTTVTEAVYRHQLRPILLRGATTMDAIFGSGES